MTRGVTVVGAPSAIGIVPYENGGPRRLDLAPAALREQRLATRLRARDLGDVEPPPRYRDVERPVGRARNEEDVAAYSRELAERVAQIRRSGDFLLLLGGDCSILLGALLGLRAVDTNSPGVIYIDAHADFATLEESPSASACSMSLALAVGRDEQRLARLAQGGALTSGDRVAHIGRREHAQTTYGDAALESCGVLDLPMSAVASNGPGRVAEQALAHATASGSGFWVHFDVDVLHPDVLPATGDLAPGGIDFAEAAELLGALLHHPAALGMQLTLYDPTLDSDRSGASNLAGMLERAVERRV